MKAIVTAFCLFGLTTSPVNAQEVNDEDPLIGVRRLSEWKKLLRHEDPNRRSETAFYLGLTRAKSAVPRRRTSPSSRSSWKAKSSSGSATYNTKP